MTFPEDADGCAGIGCHGLAHFLPLGHRDRSVRDQSRTEGEHLPGSVFQKFFGGDIIFADDLHAAVGVDHKILISGAGIPVQDSVAYHITGIARTVEVPVDGQHRVIFLRDDGCRRFHVFPIGILGKSRFQIFRRRQLNVRNIDRGVIHFVFPDLDSHVFIFITVLRRDIGRLGLRSTCFLCLVTMASGLSAVFPGYFLLIGFRPVSHRDPCCGRVGFGSGGCRLDLLIGSLDHKGIHQRIAGEGYQNGSGDHAEPFLFPSFFHS